MILFTLVWRRVRASLGSLVLTLIAIVAGVGFVSGSFILADSLSETFDSIFEESTQSVEGLVQAEAPEFGSELRTVPDSLVAELEALPEVGKATPGVVYSSINAFAATDSDGEAVTPQGPPVISSSWDGSEDGGIEIADGEAPNGIDQVTVDTGYAEAISAEVGDAVEFVTPDGMKTFTIVSTVDITTGGAFLVLFDFETAQTLYDKEGLVDSISLASSPEASIRDMLSAVDEVLPEDAEVIDQADVIAESSSEFNTIIAIIRNILLGFAGVALFVSLFIIYNTFAVLITQRMRQIGMLRAIGATRAQIRNSIVAEAFLVGLIGSVLGLAAGFGFAFLIKAGFQASGGFPDTKNVLLPRTVFVAFAVGILAAVLSSVLPAILAGRVSPIAAMRNEKASAGGTGKRVYAGVVVLIGGLVLVGLGLAGMSTEIGPLGKTTVLLVEIGVGALAVFLGVALLSVLFAGPLVDLLGRGAVLGGTLLGLGIVLLVLMISIGDGTPDSVLGWGSFSFKLCCAALGIVLGISILLSVRRGGKATGVGGAAGALEGHLARRNASRSPQRTAATAMALTVGITLVTTVGIIGQSLKESVSGALERGVQADLFIVEDGFQPFDSEITDQIAAIDSVARLTGFRSNEIRIGEDDVVGVTAYDTTSGTDLVNPAISDGSSDNILGQGVLVEEAHAEEKGYKIGETLKINFPSGASKQFTVDAYFTDTQIIGTEFVMDIIDYSDNFSDTDDLFVAAKLVDGADEAAVRVQVASILEGVGEFKVQNTGEYVEDVGGQIDGLTTLINYMLGFALLVALVGVVNTIVLSVVERAREIGLIRAVGGTRPQIRSMIRWESVMVCLLGAIVGVALGLLFARAVVVAIPDSAVDQMALPWETLAFTLLVAALAGMVAAVIPAYVGSRRGPLEAIASGE